MNVPVPEGFAIRPSSLDDAEAFRECLDIVARERRWLNFLEAPSLGEIRRFLSDSRPIQLVAEGESGMVGWCDVTPDLREGFRHSGTLGMGLLPEFRGIGLGRALLVRTLDEAWQTGLSRIELEVFGSNEAAMGLYEWAGFRLEGRKVAARILDGQEDDIVLMALLGGRDG